MFNLLFVYPNFSISITFLHFTENSASDEELNLEPSNQCEHSRLKSRAAELLAHLVNCDQLQINAAFHEKLNELIGDTLSNEQVHITTSSVLWFLDYLKSTKKLYYFQLEKRLVKCSFDYLKSGWKNVEKSDVVYVKSRAIANLLIAEFCRKHLKQESGIWFIFFLLTLLCMFKVSNDFNEAMK